MDYSINDIKEEYYNQKQKLDETKRQLELLKRYLDEGRNVEKLIEEKKKEEAEILDIILSILEYCSEKKDSPNKSIQIIREFNENQKRYSFLDANYKFKSKRIVDEMNKIKENQKQLLKEINIEKIPYRLEKTKLGKLIKEIDEYLRNRENENIKSSSKKEDMDRKQYENKYVMAEELEKPLEPEIFSTPKYITEIPENKAEQPVPDKELKRILFEGEDAIKPEMPEIEELEKTQDKKDESKQQNITEDTMKYTGQTDKINAKVKRKKPLKDFKEKIQNVSKKANEELKVENVKFENIEGEENDRGKIL